MKFIQSLLSPLHLGDNNNSASFLSEDEMSNVLGGTPASGITEMDYWWIDDAIAG